VVETGVEVEVNNWSHITGVVDSYDRRFVGS
jgi:hypothetical protein